MKLRETSAGPNDSWLITLSLRLEILKKCFLSFDDHTFLQEKCTLVKKCISINFQILITAQN